MRDAEVAQQVEQRTENPRVAGSIPAFGTSASGSSSVVECLLAKEEVASSNLVFRSIVNRAEVAEQADAMVSKTIGGQPSCRFDPDLRQFKIKLPSCVVVARRPLKPFAEVRILARQPVLCSQIKGLCQL